MNRVLAAAAAGLVIQFCEGSAAAGPHRRTERVAFGQGDSSSAVTGRIEGYADVDYVVRAGAGQVLAAVLSSTNPACYFNVLPPDSSGAAMYIGQLGDGFTGMLPADGDYTIRVYLVRAAARRDESSDYTLTIALTGNALPPVPAARDAMVPGTLFHASGRISCVPYLEALGANQTLECEAFVSRRGYDGTATVEIPQANTLTRRILFVKGTPVASDFPGSFTFSRRDDTTIVTFDTGERYEVPDSLIHGG